MRESSRCRCEFDQRRPAWAALLLLCALAALALLGSGLPILWAGLAWLLAGAASVRSLRAALIWRGLSLQAPTAVVLHAPQQCDAAGEFVGYRRLGPLLRLDWRDAARGRRVWLWLPAVNVNARRQLLRSLPRMAPALPVSA